MSYISKNKNRCKALLWDLDGTLVDNTPLYKRAWEETLTRSRLEITGWWADHLFGYSTRGRAARLFPGSLPGDYAWLVASVESRYETIIRSGLPMVNGATELLAGAEKRGVVQALATGSSREYMERTLDMLTVDVKEHFSALVCGDDVEEAKPSPDVFLLAAKLLGVSSGNCWVLEDSPIGVEAAKAAGMGCVAITTGLPASALCGADIIVNSFNSELLTRMVS